MYLLPPPLKPGDTIGIAAPASAFDHDAFAKGAEHLSQMGFKPYIPETLFASQGYFAGTDAHRARLLTQLFMNDAVNAVMCARGGFGSPRVLPLLDYNAIRKHPKAFIGFSDITALLCAVSERCGWVTFHGPMVLTLPETDADSQRALGAVIRSEFPLTITPREGEALRPGVASGPVIGGNLTTLCHLLGTPFEPVWKGRILFIEECGEALYRIDRMLTHLKLAGCLDSLAGLVLGMFDGIDAMADVWRIVMSLTQTAAYPVAAGFPIGHGAQNMTIPMGMTATLDAGKPRLMFNPGSELCR